MTFPGTADVLCVTWVVLSKSGSGKQQCREIGGILAAVSLCSQHLPLAVLTGRLLCRLKKSLVGENLQYMGGGVCGLRPD